MESSPRPARTGQYWAKKTPIHASQLAKIRLAPGEASPLVVHFGPQNGPQDRPKSPRASSRGAPPADSIRRKSLISRGGGGGGNGEAGGTRTHDPRLKRPLLYQLSYRPEVERGGVRQVPDWSDYTGSLLYRWRTHSRDPKPVCAALPAAGNQPCVFAAGTRRESPSGLAPCRARAKSRCSRWEKIRGSGVAPGPRCL